MAQFPTGQDWGPKSYACIFHKLVGGRREDFNFAHLPTTHLQLCSPVPNTILGIGDSCSKLLLFLKAFCYSFKKIYLWNQKRFRVQDSGLSQKITLNPVDQFSPFSIFKILVAFKDLIKELSTGFIYTDKYPHIILITFSYQLLAFTVLKNNDLILAWWKLPHQKWHTPQCFIS